MNFKNEFRIKYYLGKVNKPIKIVENKVPFKITLFDNKDNSEEKLRSYFHQYVKVINNLDSSYCNKYFNDLYNYLNEYKKYNHSNNIQFLFVFGDDINFKKLPCFVKAKCIQNDDYSVLLKLNSERHIGMLNHVKDVDIPFNFKQNKLLWRGSSTGNRIHFVNKFYNHPNSNIDIKFSNLCQNVQAPSESVVGIMSYSDMLQYKFIISIEGNDVATNLKWILLSNSVLLMPLPTKCTWFMEDTLIPFTHFIPIESDYSDVECKFQWCLNNLKKCEEISKNGTKYMEQFLDEENEKLITNEVIKNYLQNVKFIE